MVKSGPIKRLKAHDFLQVLLPLQNPNTNLTLRLDAVYPWTGHV